MNDREQAWCLLTEFTQSESLRKHGLAVEACMRAYARKFASEFLKKKSCGASSGLLHDFDYEKYPSLDDHPYKGNEILKERGYSDEIRRAIMSHAEYSGVTRDSPWKRLSSPATNWPDSSPPAPWSSRESPWRRSRPSQSEKR